jgi:hypothetical protein
VSWPFDPGGLSDWAANWPWLRPDAPEFESLAPNMPTFDPFAPVIDAIRDRVVGKRRTLRVKDREVGFTLDDVTVTGSDPLRSIGQYGEVEMAGHHLEWGARRIERFVIRACNVHVRAGRGPTLVTAPVLFDAHVAPDELLRWSTRLPRWLDVTFHEGGAQLRLAGRAPLARLDVTSVADGRAIRVVPVALWMGSRRVRLRLPGYSVGLGSLPPTVLITGVEVTADDIIVSGVYTEWRWSLSRNGVKSLIAALRRGTGLVNP